MFILNLTCILNALANYSSAVHAFLDVCHTETSYAQEVKEADWVTNMVQFVFFGYSLAKQLVAFTSPTRVITQEKANV